MTPGDYFVMLSVRENGVPRPLTRPTTIRVVADPLSPLRSGDYDALATFRRDTRSARRDFAAISNAAADLATRLDLIRAGLDAAPRADDAAKRRVRAAIADLRVIRRSLSGDAVLAARNENVPMSAADRLRYAASANEESLSLPTGTQKQALADGKRLTAEGAKALRPLVDKELPELEKALEAAGGLPLPGRLPAPANPQNPGVSRAIPAEPGQNLATAYADLAAVVAAWPTLPDAIRRAVLAIVQTAIPSPTGSTLRQLDDRAPAGYEPRQAGG